MSGIGGLKAILIVNLGGIGDLLLSTPALRSIKSLYPYCRFEALTSPGAGDLAEKLRLFDRVHILRASGGLVRPFDITGDVRTIVSIRKSGFDLAVNMRTLFSKAGAVKIRTLFGLIGAKRTAGRNTAGRGDFFDIKIPETVLGDRYEMEYDIELAEKLGATVTDRAIVLPLGDVDRERAARILSDGGICPDDIVVGIHPGGKPSRRWPAERFAETVSAIRAKLRCAFIITGTADERRLAEKIVRSASAKVIDTTGKADIGTLAALIERCALYIANDTATMHIAAAEKVGLVAIFGPGDLKRFDPRSISRSAVVIRKTAGCAPCEKMRCQSMKCLKAISPEEVTEAALQFLKI